MDLFEESREDRLIEDYLFSGYKPHNNKSTFDADQQFARPIEDEDLFCVKEDLRGETDEDAILVDIADQVLESSTEQFDLDDRPFRRLSDEPLCDTNINSPGKLFEDEASDPLSPSNVQQEDAPSDPSIDEIFLDDYSESGDAANSENIRPTLVKSYSKPTTAPQPTPAQVKKKLMMERWKQQALAMQQKKPRPSGGISSRFGKDGFIEVSLEHSKLVSDSSSKFIFNKLFNQSKKANELTGSVQVDKKDWQAYKTMLRKRICAQKRKVWDSFQAPADAYDEEEELVGAESVGGSEKDNEEADDDQIQAISDAEMSETGDAEGKVSENSEVSDSEEVSKGELLEDGPDDPEILSSNHASEVLNMDCDNMSSSTSDGEIVRKKIIYTDDESDDSCVGDARKFIDDEVEVDEDLY